ncbi:MAG: 50S ribosomal protein L22 [Patescibacteria group bacterium]
MAKTKVTAKLSYLRMSPRKVRLVANLLSGMPAEKAIIQLENMTKISAGPMLKLLRSAIANAKHNYEMKEEGLMLKKIIVNDGPILRRWMPRAMGRATPIRKRSSHIEITLEGDAPEKKEKKNSAIEN